MGKPYRINPSGNNPGWEYNFGGIGCVRRFDDGSRAYFFDTEWNGVYRRSYVCHVDPPKTDVIYKYRLRVIVSFGGDEREEFSVWGCNRREVFSKMRKRIDNMRRALGVIPV
jgi:hypothetical protein